MLDRLCKKKEKENMTMVVTKKKKKKKAKQLNLPTYDLNFILQHKATTKNQTFLLFLEKNYIRNINVINTSYQLFLPKT